MTDRKITWAERKEEIRLEKAAARKARYASGQYLVKDDPAHQSWLHMKQRCRNPANHAYEQYGGRGIDYCEVWEVFSQFKADMGPRPEGYTLDRIDNNGDYTPENCRWATKSEQRVNQRPQTEARSDSLSGIRGVTQLANGTYQSRGLVEDQYINLYQGPSLELAIAARDACAAGTWVRGKPGRKPGWSAKL